MLDPTQIELKRKYASGKKESMKRRANNHDYTERRMYMITIEVAGRRPLFGQLVGNPYKEGDSVNAPHIELSPLGQAVQAEWLGIPRHFPQIEVRGIQMMPDHLHGILFVKDKLPVHLGQVISGFKAGCRHAQRAIAEMPPSTDAAKLRPTEENPAVPSPQVTASPQVTTLPSPSPEASSPQATVSPQVTALPSPTPPLFARGYNDLILRSYNELAVWQNYLRDNPRRLMLKRARPEWLRPFFELKVGTTTYNGVGNRALLQAPRRVAIKISRRLSQQEIDLVIERYMNEARQGAVLVSPSISPGEKQVMRAAFDAGYPLIILTDNGFTPLTKPMGRLFYGCARGQLLMLSPWKHHNNNMYVTVQQCRQLNYMAIELCQNREQSDNNKQERTIGQ